MLLKNVIKSNKNNKNKIAVSFSGRLWFAEGSDSHIAANAACNHFSKILQWMFGPRYNILSTGSE